MKADTITAAEAERTIGNPVWRLHNLYKITTKKGEVIPFVPNFVQERLIEAVHVKKRRRHLVLKARKHGVSTVFDLMILDWCYFGANLQASIIDLTHTNASDKLTKIVRFAWENLPRELREPLVEDSGKALSFANGSNINAGKNTRGGVNQIIHVSEWGPIAHDDPKRSEEILTGALPSADTGIHLIESTFKGGKGGHFYELLKRSMETPEGQKTDKDYDFHFFPWYIDARNVLEGDVRWVDKATVAYLNEMEEQCQVRFSPAQRLWYFKMAQEQGIFMRREYPTTVDEAFAVPIEGSIYGDIISAIRAKGQIRTLPDFDRGAPVFAFWDIGWDDSTSVWLVQVIGRELFWLYHVQDRHVTAAQMVMHLDKVGIPVAGNFLPHDAGATKAATGTSYEMEMTKAGAVNIRVVPQCKSIWPGINALRDLLWRSWFRLPACKEGLEALEQYHTKEAAAGSVVTKDPVHDWSSHTADAARTCAEALTLGMVKAPTRRLLSVPRSPEGENLVDLDAVRESTRRRQSTLARSGIEL